MRIVAITAALAGCYVPSAPSNVPCGPGEACPEGQSCIAGVCNGSEPIDARPADGGGDSHLTTVAEMIAGQRFLLPCIQAISSRECWCDVDQQSITLPGSAKDHYQVTLRIRGALESGPYKSKTESGSFERSISSGTDVCIR